MRRLCDVSGNVTLRGAPRSRTIVFGCVGAPSWYSLENSSSGAHCVQHMLYFSVCIRRY
jgi:hypothetical protein